ncbi:2-amino-4-hydroxy-6-hydroxymethyldihydropteridine diphosphokinase [Asanoa sp. WMMD1127]|uniref:2-amino-4-hydroxy-6- hydroxymethyldihydropteridine diphosphokinase n=1 Tax=Asanoa sp. WMMD1127 TaxID=3016107 RepID=UPI002417FEC3|nr:2-amino-4-hydroxy-6-hydroxymethyldihydropteridine diphosphokinase [Asanoa sp. WMMD1127]MDG4822423.1 2-amino-4-hydroxy-6-hydroxymethyldihydropteridine diphosphokinase [Asanoa sp. WMMD1127]
MTRAVLSLGSNLGDRLAHLRAAVAALTPVLEAVSLVYETPPWGDPDQPSYFNAVALVRDEAATARDWLDRAQAIEASEGRVRDPERRFGPRTLDVDVIAVWAPDGRPVTSDDPVLTLPHPRAHLRAFVLRPWADLEPDAELPGHGRVAELLWSGPAADDVAAVRARPELRIQSAG